MGDLGKAAKSAEEFRPLRAERQEHFLARRCEPVAAAAAAVGAGFPGAANPAALLHAVEHWIQRGQAEAQRAFSLLFDAAGHLVTVQRTVFENAQDREFRGALLNAGADHGLLPYMYESYI